MAYLTELFGKDLQKTERSPFILGKKQRMNVLALGDVGGMLLMGFRLLGGDVISSIGIFDSNDNQTKRYEAEMNQIAYPFDYDRLPEVRIIEEKDLFDCDVFVFCAAKAVPEISADVSDVRMAQLAANRKIIEYYARLAADMEYKGLFCVVSDPVDQLCMAACSASGLPPAQVQGYGLGVMNSRAVYFAKRDERFKLFLTEGRVYGPHGSGLVIANSIENYDNDLSIELTKLTVDANLRIRDLGFKPYMAPALSSGAISILLTLRGAWHYSSNYVGSGECCAFFGMKNRMTDGGAEFENPRLPDELFERIKTAYDHLRKWG